jgi:hypothetical protein
MGEEDNPAAAESTEVYALQGSVGATADALPRLTPEYLRFKRARDEQRTAERAARSVGFSADYTYVLSPFTVLYALDSCLRVLFFFQLTLSLPPFSCLPTVR